jgi:putative transposase
MNFQPGHIYHIYNQGNNKQMLFHDGDDYTCFQKLTQATLHKAAGIIAYCFMPNHFHFLVMTDARCNEPIRQGNLLIDPVTNSIRKLLSSYARIHNTKYDQSGSVFRQKTKARQLSTDQNMAVGNTDAYLNCFNYIHQNPLKAGLVTRVEDWEYSSFNDYAGLREVSFVAKKLAAEICGYDTRRFMSESPLCERLHGQTRDGQTM